MRLRAKIDDNQNLIVDLLRDSGCQVLSLAPMGRGCADLLVGKEYRRCPTCGETWRLKLLEVKDGSKPPSKRKLTPHQVLFHQNWPVIVVENEIQALQAIQLHSNG